MTLSEVSQKYGLSPDALRYYEKVGAIPPVPRSAAGIREYGEAECGWVELATCMRGAGLPIEALVEYVRLYGEGDDTLAARKALLERERAALAGQIEAMQAALRRLDFKISRYAAALETGVLDFNEGGEEK